MIMMMMMMMMMTMMVMVMVMMMMMVVVVVMMIMMMVYMPGPYLYECESLAAAVGVFLVDEADDIVSEQGEVRIAALFRRCVALSDQLHSQGTTIRCAL